MSEFMKGTRDGWVKYGNNPVLGGDLGVCFDLCVHKEKNLYRMWFSWRTENCIALTESPDGIHWSKPVKCIEANPASGWEDGINRCSVVIREGKYHMWYTGQIWKNSTAAQGGEGYLAADGIIYNGESKLGYAVSDDGKTWQRYQKDPVLKPEADWEKVALMCPNVLWDEKNSRYTIWYSAGEQYEPNAIGYATSADGINWKKYENNPVFAANPESSWEKHKCSACHVLFHDNWYYMFYIGFHNEDYAQIGVARSRDGLTKWERSSMNPIIAPDDGAWDGEACYKPYVIFEDGNWKLWYNGRRGTIEQIGLATHAGAELTF